MKFLFLVVLIFGACNEGFPAEDFHEQTETDETENCSYEWNEIQKQDADILDLAERNEGLMTALVQRTGSLTECSLLVDKLSKQNEKLKQECSP